MDTTDKCKNCGGERGLHHYETDQCPVGGREAPVGKRQEWKSTTFEEDKVDEFEELWLLVVQIAKDLREINKTLERIADVVGDFNDRNEASSNLEFMTKLYKVE